MTEKSRPIAKLTRPAVAGLLQRERLFMALDAAAAAKLVWIAAPAGAGKTSLIATWLEAGRRRALWYSLDGGDGDPASFFYYLGAAARQEFGAADLPPYSEGQRLHTFARRFGERFFAAAEAPQVVVLDNYETLLANAPVHEAIDAFLDSVPSEHVFVIASRSDPPAPLARWGASAAVQWIEAAALRLTRDETATLAQMRGLESGPALDTLHDVTRGWAAGVVLFARAAARGMSLAPPPAAPQAVLDYFARDVFVGVTPEVRRFLLSTAFLPHMTPATAQAVSGDANADRVLEALHHAHLFIERKRGADALYEYHPLFRESLRAEARATFDAATLRGLRGASADALVAHGDVDAAVPLYTTDENWRALTRVVRAHARTLVAYGRHKRLAQWMEPVPDAVLDVEPWLAFWSGWCRMAEGRTGWRTLFVRAAAGFERAGDIEGVYTSYAWLLRSSVTPEEAARWIAALERLTADHPQFDDPETEAVVISQFRLVHQFPPHHPLVERWAARAEGLLRVVEDVGLRLHLAAYALHVRLTHGALRRVALLLSETQALTEAPDAPPGEEVVFLYVFGMCQLQLGEIGAAESILQRMERLAETTGALSELYTAWHFGCRLALATGDRARAHVYQARLRQVGTSLPPHMQHGHTISALLRLAEGDLDGALAAARAAAAYHDLFPMFRPLWEINQAQILLVQGDTTEASAALDRAITSARGWRLPAPECTALLLRAATQLQLGEHADADASLREGLSAARELSRVPRLTALQPATLAQVIARALERSIEREVAVDIARRWHLTAPSPEEERWPWPVRVRTLGDFALMVAGKQLDFAARTQRRPIELLKYVIAMGGRDVSVQALCHALWPNAGGGAGKGSFEITLHRLRRLLECDEAILHDSGKLALNTGVVWVDALAFDRLAGRPDVRQRATRVIDAAALEIYERALRLYQGTFLDSDHEAWIQAARERLRGRYIRLVESLGEELERAARRDDALACYERAVELDPAAERIYRRLMYSLHAQGRGAEALEVYRRCTDVLRASLGVRPSPETEALYARLRSN